MEPVRNEEDFTCLTHADQFATDLEVTLKTLRGRVIPKILAKRVPYLVCTCKKKHTALDDEFKNKIDITSLILSMPLKSVFRNKPHNGSDSHETESTPIDVEITGDSDKEIGASADCVTEEKENSHHEGDSRSSSDICESAKSNNHGSDDDTVQKDSVFLDSLINGNTLLQKMFSDGCVSVSQGRLLTIIYLCLRESTELLEPRPAHKQKVEELRKLRGRRVYYRKLKKPVYKYTETILINEPSISVSTYVGKHGKNIKTINKDTDCRVHVNQGRRVNEVEVTIHAKCADDRRVLVQRVHLVKTYLKQQQRDWERQQAERAKNLRLRREAIARADKNCYGRSQWDIDVEQKESARDEYSKKSSYHSHHPSRNQSGVNNNGNSGTSSRKILDEASRCLNCLITNSASLEDEKCRYHPGYTLHAIWTCCGRKLHGKIRTELGKHGDTHQYNGCTTGIHNWRRTKATSFSKKKKVPTATLR